MGHKKNCKFEQVIKELKNETFLIGEDEISGYIEVDFKGVNINDGWNFYPSIDFIYCPFCGIKIK